MAQSMLSRYRVCTWASQSGAPGAGYYGMDGITGMGHRASVRPTEGEVPPCWPWS